MDRIVHIVAYDKFTEGYINGMCLLLEQYDNRFIVLNRGILNTVDQEKVIYVKKYGEIFFNRTYINILRKSNKIIISGLFGIERTIFFFPSSLLRKTYIQFWGADFYGMRETKSFLQKIRRVIKISCIKRCNAIINLIDEDYEEFVRICGIKKRHFTAPMLGDPRKRIDYSQYLSPYDDGKRRIIIGNSATKENRHMEVFDLLKPIVDKNTLILCPLSYGDIVYRDHIIDIGKQYFGSNFIPILDFMERERYVQLLSKCDIGIYNNNRQQGMGNINRMLLLGKKVYLATGTSMWKRYTNNGIRVFDVQSIKKSSLSDVLSFENHTKDNNRKEIERLTCTDKGIELWNKIFEAEL